MSNVIEISADGFQEAIANGKVLIDFWAPWCGPCKMMLPVLDQVAAEVDDVKIYKCNIDDNGSLAVEYGVSSVPCFILFENGSPVKTFTGVQSKVKLIDALK